MTERLKFTIRVPNKKILHALEQRLERVQGGIGKLGVLEKLVLKLGVLQGSLHPVIQHPKFLLFAGDHLTGLKLSNDPISPAARRVNKMLLDEAPVLRIAHQAEIDVKIIDCGIHYPLEGFIDYWMHKGSLILNRKIRGAARDFIHEASLTTHEVHQAIAYGADLINSYYYLGSNVFLLGHIGSSCKISTLALGASIFEVEPSSLLHLITVEDEILLKNAVLALKKHPKTRDPINQIAIWGTYQIAMMVGAILKLAEKELLIVVDDEEALLALYLAWKLHPEVAEYAILAQNSSLIAQHIQRQIQIQPVFDFKISAEEGMGAVPAFQLLKMACEIFN
ncbi:nicotinate-nucleotide--dimethylbenzimidazole phosphoribosyltransferase [Thermaurantimonas aggregans]|uniref:nicotinate-nucleotide--dimethylbenzimidazole phosphoribosyltransferase n=1 Tax=Thermaurantimonas aggregans TaxID=2173829 RepID=UPI0023EFAD1B|nr:nicotinate-nucleotide--dimethylbenzimidazole phosphoribosyltransferase [Thermaurantimonas aggregans]MCX8148879.1 nicotinate-nucleotide--dimethylbenzimidazole phosphoribosyltransferase [Thermaurantimonas aggregans]